MRKNIKMPEYPNKPFTLLLKNPLTFRDDRGRMQVLYEKDNVVLKRSRSIKGVFRGLHRQTRPSLQDKLIRVISGRIYDFVTDPDDPDDFIWYREIGPETDWIHIKSHLAHGFFALEDVEFEYFCDGRYNEAHEESFNVIQTLKDVLCFRKIIISNKDRLGKELSRPIRRFEDI